MNWLTLAVIAFIVLMILWGAKRGFVKTFFSIAAVILAIIITGAVKEPAADLIKNKTQVYEVIDTKISSYVDDSIGNMILNGKNSVAKAVDQLKLPGLIRESIIDDAGNTKNVAAYISRWLADLVFSIIVYIITFIAVWIILKILSVFLCNMTRLPVIHEIDSIAGAVTGCLLSFLVLWIGCLVVTVAASSAWGRQAGEMIRDSALLSYIYDHNYLIYGIINAISKM